LVATEREKLGELPIPTKSPTDSDMKSPGDSDLMSPIIPE